MYYNESEFIIETQVPDGVTIVSRTDLDGNITYVNEVFCEISAYDEEELLGKAHNILRHPDMPTSVFKDLWETIKRGENWEGIVKNLRKDKSFYWVRANISNFYKDGELVGYKSIRVPITNDEKIEYQKLYDRMRQENGDKMRKITYK
jgi:aerotaxis receptor